MIALDTMSSHNMGTMALTEDDISKIQEYGVETIDSALFEFKDSYPNQEPYTEVPMLDGPCFIWNDEFIEKCKVAMATDRLVQFNSQEIIVWQFLVNFENYHTHSAKDTDANGTAVGCTNPNDKQQSFVVASDGAILNGENNSKLQFCQPPGYEVESEEIWKSLDKAFMSLYNCEEINDCGNSDIVVEYPCTGIGNEIGDEIGNEIGNGGVVSN